MGINKYRNGFQITIHPEALNIPFTWKKSRMVFVNSMSDLFHEEVPSEFIQAVFLVMNKTPQHTYQILTKRPDRLLTIAEKLKWTSNIWMGVSVESEKYINRVLELSQTPAKVKFLSVEPLIGYIPFLPLDNINWVIVGGESGHKARPIKYEWIESIRSQCRKNNIPFFFKQWGKPKFNANADDPTIDKTHPNHAKGGCQLNGEIYRELPL